MKILVTAGGTKEYIDGVRYIGNSSSGQTGADLVDYLSGQGHDVTWLGAKGAIRPASIVTQLEYETFDDLATALQQVLSNHQFDAVFQAAAVSDFKVASIVLDGEHFVAGRNIKLPTADEVQLILSKQPKLVSSIKSWSANANIMVVAFKLTNSTDQDVRQAAIAKLMQQEVIDLVAHNDLNEMTAVVHGFSLYSTIEHSESCMNVKVLADKVINKLEASL